MRSLKKIGLLACGLGIALTLFSCSNTTDNGGNTGGTGTPSEVVDTYESISLTSITLDYSKAKTVFYLGEDFTDEGLVVTRNVMKRIGNETARPAAEVVDNYYLDLENVDMGIVGTYPVVVKYRYESRTVESQYRIEVRSSRFDEAGVEYVSGLEIKYDGKAIETLKLNQSFTFNSSLVTATVHKTKLENGERVYTSETVSASDLVIDSSAVSTSAVGDYMIKYTYTGSPLVIDGQTYENKATSFTLVSIINPVISIAKTSTADLNFRASTSALDYSRWRITITREVGAPEVVSCTRDLFTMTEICPYIAARDQLVTVTLKEDTSKTCSATINVVASTAENIRILSDMSYGYEELNGASNAQEKGRVNLVEDGSVAIVYSDTNTGETRKDDGYSGDGISFTTRVVAKPSAYIEITFTSAGVFIPYIGHKDGAGEFQVIDASGAIINNSNGQEISELTVATPSAYTFIIPAAGTYRIMALTSNTYFYGCVISTPVA